MNCSTNSRFARSAPSVPSPGLPRLIGSLLAGVLAVAAGCAPNPAKDVTEARVEPVADGSAAKPAASGATPYVVADGSKIEFVGSKVTGTHVGGFKRFTGTFELDDGKLVGGGNRIVIDMDSTWSDNDRLTGHLKSPDFFDVAVHPTATFEITSARSENGSDYDVTGRLTLHGVTKQVSFPAKLVIEDDEARLTAEFFIKRFDFDIRYPGKPDDLIRDEVVIKLDLKIEPATA